MGSPGKHPEAIGNLDPRTSRRATHSLSCARLSLSQLRRGKPLGGRLQPQVGVGSTGKHPGFIPDPRASRWATHVPSYTRLSLPQRGGGRRGGEAPQRGIAAPRGVGSPGKHPGCIPDPWISRCAVRVPPTLSQAPHPPAATSDGPTWDGDSRVYPGACRLGTRVGHPGIACRRNVGWELSGEVKSGGHRSYSCRSWLRACSTAGLPPHSSRGSPTAQPPMAQPSTALGCSQCSPSWHRDARSAAPPTGGIHPHCRTEELCEDPRKWGAAWGGDTHTRGPWLKSQSLSPHSRGRDSSTGTRLRAGTRGW